MDAKTRQRLLEEAHVGAEHAYCPYSKFRVGAAVLVGGKVYRGSNIENASYGNTICAERVAIFSAVLHGARLIEAVAVTCPDADPNAPPGFRMPCGSCRQVMAEFGGDDLLVLVDEVGVFTLRDLLPEAFRLAIPIGVRAPEILTRPIPEILAPTARQTASLACPVHSPSPTPLP